MAAVSSIRMNAQSLKASSGSFAKGDASVLRVTMPARAAPTAFVVEANKAVTKKKQVVLTKTVEGLGKAGALVSVPIGYVRNYLVPQGYARVATTAVLQKVAAEQAAEVARKAAIKKEAQQMATALTTIGKFTIKKPVGQDQKIFGSVTSQEVADAIYKQTGRQLEKKDMDIPDISTLGDYTATIKLHPEVIGTFTVSVVKQPNA